MLQGLYTQSIQTNICLIFFFKVSKIWNSKGTEKSKI